MTAPITPDERAAMRERYAADLPSAWDTSAAAHARALRDLGTSARNDVPRLLDALATAEAERDEARAEVAPSVVPEAAVEAAALAVRKERAFSAAAAFGVPMDAVPQCAEMIARAALTAALPLMTAAPSATRDEVVDALVMTRLSDYAGTDMAVITQTADRLLARFTITPKEDR